MTRLAMAAAAACLAAGTATPAAAYLVDMSFKGNLLTELSGQQRIVPFSFDLRYDTDAAPFSSTVTKEYQYAWYDLRRAEVRMGDQSSTFGFVGVSNSPKDGPFIDAFDVSTNFTTNGLANSMTISFWFDSAFPFQTTSLPRLGAFRDHGFQIAFAASYQEQFAYLLDMEYRLLSREISPIDVRGSISYRDPKNDGPPVPNPPAIPEPGTWALMLVGFGLVGGALRSRWRRGAALA